VALPLLGFGREEVRLSMPAFFSVSLLSFIAPSNIRHNVRTPSEDTEKTNGEYPAHAVNAFCSEAN
jgi:hypothetical protein